MSKWKGSLISASAATSSGTNYIGRADGKWSAQDQIQANKAGLWSIGIGNPSVPVIGTATATSGSTATVEFTPSSLSGGGTITYTATSNPSNITGTALSSPITVAGLSSGMSYTFTVYATNSFGYTSATSNASNSVTLSDYDKGIIYTVLDSTPNSLAFYGWNDTIGFSTKYTNTTSQASYCQGGAVRNISNDIAVAAQVTPYISVFPYVKLSGFGTKFSDPSTLPAGIATSVSFTTSGNAIVVSGASTPYIHAYAWSNGFGSKFSNPSTLPTTTCYSVSFNNTDTFLSILDETSLPLKTYAWSASGFGSRFSSPASFSPSYVLTAKFSKNGNYIAAGVGSSPYINVFPFSGSGYGTIYSNPATLPSGQVRSVKFNSSETLLACAGDSSPIFSVYNWSASGFGSRYNNPSTMPNGTSSAAINFNPAENVISVGSNQSPYINAYAWNYGFGTKFASPSSTPSSGINSVNFAS